MSATLFGFIDSIWTLFLLSLLAYLGYDILFIALEGFLIDNSSKLYFNYSTSGFFSLYSAGYVLGPLVAVGVISSLNLNSVYLLAIPICIITLTLFTLFFKKEFINNNQNKKIEFNFKEQISYFSKLIKSNNLILFGIFICTFWHSTMIIGIPLYFAIDEGSIWSAALVATAFALPFVFTDFIDGFIAINRHRRFLIITSGFFLGSIAMGAFFLTENILFAMLFAFISTIGVNLAWATFEIEAAFISKNQQDSGKVESVFVFSKNMGWDTAPFIFGLVALLFGMKIPFLFVGVILLLMSILFFLHHKQIK